MLSSGFIVDLVIYGFVFVCLLYFAYHLLNFVFSE
jgi:hypothetical protein